MHQNRTDQLIRRAIIMALLAAALVVGALSPGRADAATSSGRAEATEVTGATGGRATTTSPPVAQLLDTATRPEAAVASGGGSPILADFTPDPGGGASGAVLFDVSGIDGLAVAPAEGPGASPSPGHYVAGEGCSIQCITGGVAYARGVGAYLDVTTSTQATITIVVDGPGFQGHAQSGPGQVGFGHHFDDLEPGQTYHAWAIAMDPSGHVSVAEGDFVTLERHVTISMSHAALGQHRFQSSLFAKHQWVEGQWLDQHRYGGLPLQQGGFVVWLEEEIELASVDRFLDLAVQLHERKDPWDCWAAWASPFVDQPMVGHSGCDAWAYVELAAGDDDLDARPADATSWVEHTLDRTLVSPSSGGLPGDYGDALSFTVEVELHVTYA